MTAAKPNRGRTKRGCELWESCRYAMGRARECRADTQCVNHMLYARQWKYDARVLCAQARAADREGTQ